MPPFPAGLMRMWPISTRVNKPAIANQPAGYRGKTGKHFLAASMWRALWQADRNGTNGRTNRRPGLWLSR
jgi:hypothetical protein